MVRFSCFAHNKASVRDGCDYGQDQRNIFETETRIYS
jgi:hypothetical protein